MLPIRGRHRQRHGLRLLGLVGEVQRPIAIAVLLNLKLFAARDEWTAGDLVTGALVAALLLCGAGWHPAADWQSAWSWNRPSVCIGKILPQDPRRQRTPLAQYPRQQISRRDLPTPSLVSDLLRGCHCSKSFPDQPQVLRDRKPPPNRRLRTTASRPTGSSDGSCRNTPGSRCSSVISLSENEHAS